MIPEMSLGSSTGCLKVPITAGTATGTEITIRIVTTILENA
jgi:hypothetical protein